MDKVSNGKKLIIENISQLAKVIYGREKGIEIVSYLKSQLPNLAKTGLLAMNLEGVETIDYPAADEIIKGMFALSWAGEILPGQRSLWLGGRENVLETLTAAHRDRDLVGFHFKDIESLKNNNWRLLGMLPKHLDDTLRELFRAGTTDVNELAKRMEITNGACQNRLVDLMRRGLVIRRIASSYGKYNYEFSCHQEKYTSK